jgi:hypothetical protein
MAKNPDPTLELTSSKGVTRTLDDWATMFHLCLVILPDRPEASAWVPVGRRIFAVFGDADCHTAFVVTGNEQIARRILGSAEREVLTFIDPDRAFVRSLGLEHLPAFVHLRQDTTLGDAAEGWNEREWQRVATRVGKAMAWSQPEVAAPGNPPPTPGWAV